VVARNLGRCALASALSSALMIGLCAPADAAPADLDRSFGGDGSVRVEGLSGAPFPSEGAARMAIGPNDDVFVLYTSSARCAALFDCELDLSVLRYDRDGNRDPSFGVGPGSQWTVPWSGLEASMGFAVGPDGRAVATTGGSVVRFDQTGHLDGTFGSGGVAPTIGVGLREESVLAVQEDGKVLLAGEGNRGESSSDLRLVRYLSNGEPDLGFGNGGEAVVTASTRTRPAGIMLGPGGGITVATPRCCGGSALFGNGFSLARLLPDGRPDPGLDGDGQLLFPTPGAQATVEAAALAPDGSAFVVFEEDMIDRATTGNLVKLQPSGAIDSAFGGGGRLRLYTRVGSTRLADLTVDPKGRLIGAGSEGAISVFRLSPDGSKDRTFKGGLPVSLKIRRAVIGTAGVGLQSNGRIIVLWESHRSARKLFGLFALRGGTDSTRCLGHRATIIGTRGRDELVGTPRRDVVAALAGRDKVRGLGGADLICGGKGTDNLGGGAGKDQVKQ
jgi:uncharacterized delta-60 repeat protein